MFQRTSLARVDAPDLDRSTGTATTKGGRGRGAGRGGGEAFQFDGGIS